MIPLAVPRLDGNEARYLAQCIETGFVSSVGPFVSRFEEQIAKLCQTQNAVATSSGTTALHLALTTVGVRPGDLVLLPSFTFIASANAITHCGATPWLMDVNRSTWNLDLDLLERSLKLETFKDQGKLFHKLTKKPITAILVVFTLGLPPDLKRLNALAQEYGLKLVSDAAPALGVKFLDQPINDWADFTAFSFNGNKTVTAGGGGALVSKDPELLKKARHLSTTARQGIEYEHDEVGFNYRMTNLQAAVGCAQLERLEEFIEIKRKIRRRYSKELGELPGLAPFPDPTGQSSVCWFSGVFIENFSIEQMRVVTQSLREQGIEGRTFWKPIHLQKPYWDAPTTKQEVSESIWSGILTLPSSTGLTDVDQSYVIQNTKKILNRLDLRKR